MKRKHACFEAGNDFNFVTNIDEILSDKDITIVVELMGRIELKKLLITRALGSRKHVDSRQGPFWLFMVQSY